MQILIQYLSERDDLFLFIGKNQPKTLLVSLRLIWYAHMHDRQFIVFRSEKGPSWGLIAGLVSLIFSLGFCSICCLYRLLWWVLISERWNVSIFHRSRSARKRIKEEDKAKRLRQNHISVMKTEIENPDNSHQIHRFESVNQCSQSILFSAASLSNSSSVSTKVNLEKFNGTWMRQDK